MPSGFERLSDIRDRISKIKSMGWETSFAYMLNGQERIRDQDALVRVDLHSHCVFCGYEYFDPMKLQRIRPFFSGADLCESCRRNSYVRHETNRVIGNLWRAIKSDTPADLTVVQWFDTIDYFGDACAYCGSDFNHMEHIIPIAQGGGTTKSNCVPSCRKCNMAKKQNWAPPSIQDKYIEVLRQFLADTLAT